MHSLICDFCSSDQRFARGLVGSPHPASLRFHLTMNTLAFGYILPTTGWIPDFHRLETCAAGRTMRKRARWPTYRLPRPFFFCAHLSALCFFFPFRLTFHFQNTVDILLDNVVFLDLLFQLPIVGIQGFFLLLKCCVLCLQGGKAW